MENWRDVLEEHGEKRFVRSNDIGDVMDHIGTIVHPSGGGTPILHVKHDCEYSDVEIRRLIGAVEIIRIV